MIATRDSDSDTDQSLEGRRLHKHARTFDVDDLLPPEVAQQTRDRFASGSDHLCNLFVREKNLQSSSLRRLVAAPLAPVEKESGQLFGGALREAERANLALCCAVLLTQLLCGVKASLGMRVKECEEIFATNEVDLRRLERLRGNLIGRP